MRASVQQGSAPRIDELVLRVRGEYREMPGLSLTVPQAQRLWGLEPAICQTLFQRLVEARFLRRTRHGRFVRWDVSSPSSASGEAAVRAPDPRLGPLRGVSS